MICNIYIEKTSRFFTVHLLKGWMEDSDKTMKLDIRYLCNCVFDEIYIYLQISNFEKKSEAEQQL